MDEKQLIYFFFGRYGLLLSVQRGSIQRRRTKQKKKSREKRGGAAFSSSIKRQKYDNFLNCEPRSELQTTPNQMHSLGLAAIALVTARSRLCINTTSRSGLPTSISARLLPCNHLNITNAKNIYLPR